jgi:hypothetical protein
MEEEVLVEELIKENSELRADLKLCREALEHYFATDNHLCPMSKDSCGCRWHLAKAAMARARKWEE